MLTIRVANNQILFLCSQVLSALVRRFSSPAPPTEVRCLHTKSQVWNEYPSSAIARGHILAYRLMKKALEINGGNIYLGNGLHCNVRRDFIDCDRRR